MPGALGKEAGEVQGAPPFGRLTKTRAGDPHDVHALPTLLRRKAKARTVITVCTAQHGYLMIELDERGCHIGSILSSGNNIRMERLIEYKNPHSRSFL